MGSILLVRHGQASFGAADYDVLSELGVRQSTLVGGWLAGAGVAPAAVVHGAPARQRDTASAVVAGARSAGAAWPAPRETDPGWDEFDHLGVLAAHEPDAVGFTDQRAFQQHMDAALRAWVAGGGDEPDVAGETFLGFWARVGAALDRACADAGSGRTVVVVSSGGAIASVAARLLDPEAAPAALATSWQRLNAVMINTSYTRVIVGRSGPRLLSFNEHPHLLADEGLLTHR